MRPRIPLVLGVLTALIGAPDASAQDALPPLSEYQVRRFLPEDGLPVRWTGGLSQSPSGELFVATGDGLYRFDGYRFSSEGLDAFAGVFLLQDLLFTEAGRLWLRASDRRIGFHDGRRGALLDAGPDGIDAVFSFSSTPGATWLATEKGLMWLPVGTSEPVPVEADRVLDDLSVAIVAMPNGEWLRIGEERLARVERDAAGAPTAFHPFGPRYRIRSPNRSSYLPDAAGLWLFTEDGVLRVRDGALRDEAVEVRGGGGRVLPSEIDWLRDRSTAIGASAAGGLELPPVALPEGGTADRASLALRARTGDLWAVMTSPHDERQRSHLIRIREGAAERIVLSDWAPATVVNGLLEDHEGSIWIATDQGALQLVPRRARALDAAQGAVASFTTAVLAEDDRLWIGSWGGGLQRFEGGVSSTFLREDGLPSDRIRALFRSSDGTLWVGTSKGAARLRQGRFEAARHAPDMADPGTLEVRALAETPDGSLWMGGAAGLRRRSADGWVPAADPALEDVDIWMLHTDAEGVLWIGTRNGLHRFADGVFERVADPDAPAGDLVVSAYEEPDGTIWFGSYGSGLYRHRAGTFANVRTDDGLHHAGVWKILPDDAGGLWMSSDRGVFRVERSTLHRVADRAPGAMLSPVVLQEAEGLPSRESNRASPAGARLPDGRLVFNSQDGLSVIDPEVAQGALPPPVTRIRSVLADGEPIPDGADRPTVPAGTRHLKFEFYALSYRAPNQIRYRYRLEGYDDAWYDVGSDRQAAYTNLPPGDYTFSVQAAGPGGQWQAGISSLPVRLSPFFWQRGPVQLLGLVLVLAGLVGAWRYHLERRLQMERMRLRIAADLHDDVGSSLSSIALLAEMLRARPRSERVERDRLERIHLAASDTIESLREIIWLVDPKHGNTTELIAKLRRIAADLLEGTDFEFHVAEVEEAPLSMAVMRSALLIQKEALHNVVRHAGADAVQIEVSQRRGILRLDVRDRGRGFDPEASHGGYGLENMRRRAKEAGGRLALESGDGGTRIVFEARIA